MPLTIQVVSDVICPWCYVGKRRLERALGELGLRSEARVAWLPFQLNPDMPAEGMARSEYRLRKFGPERAALLDARMAETGREEGIRFAFDRMERTPNTLRAHTLIAHAEERGRGDAVAEALFHGYFEEGFDLGDEEALVGVARQTGLGEEAREALADPELRRRVSAAEAEARRLGISGVPFFIVDGSWAVSGAQPAAEWVAALRRAGHDRTGAPAAA